MSKAPKTKTVIVTFVKKLYAEVAVEIPAEFPEEYAVTVATRDIAKLTAEDALKDDAVSEESDWRLWWAALAEDGTGTGPTYIVEP